MQKILQIVIGLLSTVNTSNPTKCVFLSNQQWKTQPFLISLYLNEYTQGFYYYPFAVNLDRWVGSCTNLNDISNRVRVSNKTEDFLSVFDMVTGINELKTLKKHVSRKCECKFDGRKCNSNQK